jgi:AcrR family transcriptional regulator
MSYNQRRKMPADATLIESKKPPRRSQAERSGEMQARLIKATVDCLVDYGYELTTTLKIAGRAGVSRGAVLHHYTSKRDLVVAAMEHLLLEHVGRTKAVAAKVQAGEFLLDDFVDFLWADYSGSFFYAWLENIAEARHDEDLRDRFVPMVREYHLTLDEIWHSFFRKSRVSNIQVDTSLNQTLCLLRGMGLQRVLRQDDLYFHRLLTSWKETLKQMIEVNDGE